VNGEKKSAPTGKSVGSIFCNIIGTNGFTRWSTKKSSVIKAEITNETPSNLIGEFIYQFIVNFTP
jgi:hypothetical protein